MFFRRILSVGVRVPLGGHDRADAERHLREVVVLDERDGGGVLNRPGTNTKGNKIVPQNWKLSAT